jgi:hypothetical protein
MQVFTVLQRAAYLETLALAESLATLRTPRGQQEFDLEQAEPPRKKKK